MKLVLPTLLFTLTCLLNTSTLFAQSKHTDSHQNHTQHTAFKTEFGEPGNSKQVDRTIDIKMLDSMRFEPSVLKVAQGETIRLRVKNAGRLMHELVIGTPEELTRHAQQMRRHPHMQHEAPHMTHVASSKQGEIIWKFTDAGRYQYACLIAGHYEAGMVGTIKVVAKLVTPEATSATQHHNH